MLGLDPAFSLTMGLVFGALIAATDPIAVVALFRSMRPSPRLTTLIEGESLLNDGTSIVFLTLILGYVAGTTTTAPAIAAQFVAMVGGGVLVGARVGIPGVSHVMRRTDDPMIEITLTVIAAYGSFVLAEQVHFSGVLATVVAGMICGGYGQRVAMSPASRTAMHAFWDVRVVRAQLDGVPDGRLHRSAAEPARVVAGDRDRLRGGHRRTRRRRVGRVARCSTAAASGSPRGWPVVLTWGGFAARSRWCWCSASRPTFRSATCSRP